MPGGSAVKNPPAIQEMQVQSLGQEDSTAIIIVVVPLVVVVTVVVAAVIIVAKGSKILRVREKKSCGADLRPINMKRLFPIQSHLRTKFSMLISALAQYFSASAL